MEKSNGWLLRSKRPECDWIHLLPGIAIYGSLGSPNVWGDVISMLESGKLEVKSIISHIMDMKSYDDFKNAMDMR